MATQENAMFWYWLVTISCLPGKFLKGTSEIARPSYFQQALFLTPGLSISLLFALALLVASGLMAARPASANPEGGTVVAGAAQIAKASPKRLDVIQGTEKAIIDWRKFSIAGDEHTHFQQPSPSAVVLNRVRGDSRSDLLGRLTANGTIMLVNPNGVLIGPGARIDVGGLVASTIDIRNENFMAGRYVFGVATNPSGTVVNRGHITVAEGGLAALVAPGVENSGIIEARLGRVTLASGNRFTLDLYGDELVQLAIGDQVAEALVGPEEIGRAHV